MSKTQQQSVPVTPTAPEASTLDAQTRRLVENFNAFEN